MELKYGIESKLGAGASALNGLQWLLLCIPIVVTSAFIAPEGEMVAYTQKMFFVMGLTMLLQLLWGSRMPLVSGPASSLLVGIILCKAQGCDSSQIYPSLMAGGALLTVLALSGLLSKLQKLFTFRVIASILVLISLSMISPIEGMVFADSSAPAWSLTSMFLVVISTAVMNHFFRGIWKSASVIIALVAGSVMWYAVQGFPTSLMTDTVRSGLILEKIDFSWGIFLSFIFCYVALFINQVGSVQALGNMVGALNMEGRTSKSTVVTGVMNMLSGIAGVIGPVEYSMSPGVVASTSCAARRPLIPVAVIMMVVAFSSDAVSFMLMVPLPVMGAVLLYLMGTQLSAGFTVVVESGAVRSFRDAMVISVPAVVCMLLSFMPSAVTQAIPALIRPIAGNGFVMGIVMVLLLENVFLREKK